jgi:hypothetical protein
MRPRRERLRSSCRIKPPGGTPALNNEAIPNRTLADAVPARISRYRSLLLDHVSFSTPGRQVWTTRGCRLAAICRHRDQVMAWSAIRRPALVSPTAG